jgi:hypothetical protein
MEIHVLLQDSALPTREQWQTGIAEAGFNLTLDETLDVRQSTGYSPAVYEGVATGFEFDIFPATDITESYEGVAERIGERDVSANFRWGSSMRECVAAYIASAVLAKLADGILYDPQEDSFFTGDEALAAARRLIETVTDLD